MTYREAVDIRDDLISRGVESMVLALPQDDGQMADYAVTVADPMQLYIPRVIRHPSEIPGHLLSQRRTPALETYHADTCRMSEGVAYKLSAILNHLQHPHVVVEYADGSGDRGIAIGSDLCSLEAIIGLVAALLGVWEL